MTIAVGTKLGRYEIRSKIGKGGMGELYLAQDTELDRPVALRLLVAGHLRLASEDATIVFGLTIRNDAATEIAEH